MEDAISRESPQDAISLATTKLNTCAALSGLGNHEDAERLAMEATRLLLAQASPDSGAPPGHEESALLAVACHNLGAEREHLGRWASAAVAFRQGAEIAGRALGPTSDMARALSASCEEALGRAQKHPETPDRPATSRPRGLTPDRPWLRKVGLAATTGSVKTSPRRRRAHSARGPKPQSGPPSPIFVADWGSSAEPYSSVAEAASVGDRHSVSRPGTHVATSDLDALDADPEQDLHSMHARSPAGVERDLSSGEWTSMTQGSSWRGSHVRLMPDNLSRGNSPPLTMGLEPVSGIPVRRRDTGSLNGSFRSAGSYHAA